jgi:CHAD domain-containing protein
LFRKGRIFITVAQSKVKDSEKVGPAYWMNRVLKELAKLHAEWAPEPIHNARVALRRCILIADIMKDLDPGSDWKPMRKAGKRLFRRLGAVRDAQVLMELVEKMIPPGDASAMPLLEDLKAKCEKGLAVARDAAEEFNRKQWRLWSQDLSANFRHLASDNRACEAISLEMWEDVRSLHRHAQKSYSHAACHQIRIALKKFRYAVENLLPQMYLEWTPDLKFLQDILGEIHDIDVLSELVTKDRRLLDAPARAAWAEKLRAERALRIEKYRIKMARKTSPLWGWREALPGERELRSAGLAKLAEWSYFVTPEFPRVRRIARFALQLYDGFANAGLMERNPGIDLRSILHAAALLQEVGHFKNGTAYHKRSCRLIRKMTPPVGWTKSELELVALVARFHRRALPQLNHKSLGNIQLPLRQSLIQLTTLLRLANAFASKPYRSVRRLELENCAGVIVVRAHGFDESGEVTPKLSEAKRLLEVSSRRLVHILSPTSKILVPKSMKSTSQRDAA